MAQTLNDGRRVIPARAASIESRSRTASALAIWGGLIFVSWLVGSWLNATRSHDMLVQAPPLTGHFDVRLHLWVAPAVVFGALAVRHASRLARGVSWRGLLILASVAAAAWVVLVGIGAGGPAHLTESLRAPADAFTDLERVGTPLAFLRGFVGSLSIYTTHVRAHPPGMLLVLWGMDRAGLSGMGWAAALEIAGGVSAVPAVLLAVREVAGEERARAAAPFLAIAPTAIVVATSADALFAGVAAWSVALLVLATGREGRRADVLAAMGGVLFGLALFLSYGLILLGIVPIAVAWNRGSWRTLAIASIGVAAVVGGFALAGFWWVAGLLATHEQYLESVAQFRPYWYFLFANLAAFAVVLGPASAVGLSRLRDRKLWLLIGAALLAVAIADLSGMSKAEVERIWLPFAVWVLPAGAALADSPRARTWLGAQALFTLIVTVAVRSTW